MRKFYCIAMANLLVTVHVSAACAAPRNALPKNLASTLDLYLSSNPSYMSGDLITKSHIEEFQIYLRRTQGHSAATHPRWKKELLDDSDPLAKLFYNGGEEILRKSAKSAGGYEKLYRLTLHSKPRQELKQAIKAKSVERIMNLLTDEAKKQKIETDDKETDGKKQKKDPALVEIRPTHLYTAEDFLAAVISSEGGANTDLAPGEIKASEQKQTKITK